MLASVINHDLPEAFMDRGELAQILGVSPNVITTWTEQGMPAYKLGSGKRRFFRYRLSEVLEWAKSRSPKEQL